MMNQVNHNRLRGKALYMEVRDLVNEQAEPVTNNQLRDLLAAKYRLDKSDREAISLLYNRVARATDQLLQDGYLDRSEELASNKHIRYTYQPKPTAQCSASTS